MRKLNSSGNVVWDRSKKKAANINLINLLQPQRIGTYLPFRPEDDIPVTGKIFYKGTSQGLELGFGIVDEFPVTEKTYPPVTLEFDGLFKN